MSLDNVLSVAGAARGHPLLLAVGLVVSIALMAVAAGGDGAGCRSLIRRGTTARGDSSGVGWGGVGRISR